MEIEDPRMAWSNRQRNGSRSLNRVFDKEQGEANHEYLLT
jgi:hypothetical protein